MIHSVGIVDIVVNADAVDIAREIDLPSATGVVRARRKIKIQEELFSLPVFISFMLSSRRECVHIEYSAIYHR